MSNRGMKKYLPFSSLTEQGVLIDKLLYEKNKIEKPRISLEQANKIDRILKQDIDKKLNIKFYLEGYLYYFEGYVDSLDIKNKVIYIDDYEIPLKNIIDIENPDIFSEIC